MVLLNNHILKASYVIHVLRSFSSAFSASPISSTIPAFSPSHHHCDTRTTCQTKTKFISSTSLLSSISPQQTLLPKETNYQSNENYNNRQDNNDDDLISSLPYYQAEQTIKKSRFIGIAKHCDNWADGQEFVQSIRDIHPKARHVCFGFVAGYNPVQERSSDDGEPTGTAGSPILNGIKGEELSDTICVVVRYSGGIKLGAGGLIRAYGGTARLVLRASETVTLIPKSTVRIRTPSSNAGQIYSTVMKYSGVTQGESYNDKGDLMVTIVCETDRFDEMMISLTDATRGDILLIDDDDEA